MRIFGLIGILLGGLAMAGELMGIAFPTARWFFQTSREIPWLSVARNGVVFPWFGWVCAVLLVILGVSMVIFSFTCGPRNPMTERKFRRFRQIKRGYISLMILILLCGVAALDQVVVGKRALAVKYEGRWTFPAFRPAEFKNQDFGLTGEDAQAPANYRRLQKHFRAHGGGWVLMPLIPYDPTSDTLPPRSRPLNLKSGVYCEGESRKPFFGLAARYFNADEGKIHMRYTLRNGVFSGPVDGWDEQGMPVYGGEYREGKLTEERYSGKGTKEEFLALTAGNIRSVKYHPTPPIPEEGNWLGTTSQGYDVLAYLYGGLQVNFKAAVLFLPIVYLIGVAVGMMMGYFGGWFDLIAQRIIEILTNIPFLFVVIIISSKVPERFKGLPIVLAILIAFGWMGMTYLMRTAAYRDRERDYISAARVLGAGAPRIIFRHLLPNTISILVTLVPFTMSGLIFSLASLDYLGFGLPPEYATWGRLLNDGLSNLSAPWLVSSTFFALVGLLVLITFVGEAVREAFDPKQFTYYR